MLKSKLFLTFTFISLISPSSFFAAASFDEPVVVQNYPVNNPLKMNEAMPANEAIKEIIESASKKIDIEVFYINNEKKDSVLNNYVITPLIEKAKAGVKVRIIVDNNMAKTYHSEVDKLSATENVELKKTSYFDGSGILHSKVIIVDDQTFYLGSHNFDWVTFELNHELGVILKDKQLALTLIKAFEFDFANSDKKPSEERFYSDRAAHTDTGRLITISPADIKGIASDKTEFINLINKSEKSIEMQAMIIDGYDIYNKDRRWNDFIDALKNASKRGVKVSLMFSDWEFCKGEIKAANKFLQELLDGDNGNIKIKYSSFPQAVPCVPYSEVNHAKYAVFDGEKVWISTANITENYFDGCRNFSFISHSDQKLAIQMRKIFQTMWNSDYCVKYNDAVTAVTDNTCSAGTE